MRSALALLLLLVAAAAIWLWRGREQPPAPPVAALPPPVPGVPTATLARLDRGVNISGWLQHGYENDPARYAPDAADWQRIHSLGLHHVRLPVDPAIFIGDRGLPKPDGLALIAATVGAANAAELTVILALQLPDELKPRLGDAATRTALAGIWRTLAVALKDTDPLQIVLEPLNEPGFEDAAASRGLMESLAREIRAVLPKHTLLVSGHRYSGPDELAALAPLADRNVVYGFHFYVPFDFTHQGADWGDPVWQTLRGVPYPSTPEIVAPRLDALEEPLRGRLRWFGDERWNRDTLSSRMKPAIEWAKTHGVPVICSEFGVLRKRAKPADRAAWIRDVRETLEAARLGWTAWDYSGPFGLVTGPQGKRVIDKQTAEALGLASPSPALPASSRVRGEANGG